MLKKEARKITGGLSAPSKMPGPAYNLPAWECITGRTLVDVIGSVVGLVKQLGSEGLVGLAAIWVLWGIYDKK